MKDFDRLMIIEVVLVDYYNEVTESCEYWHGSEDEEKSTLENIDRALSACRAMLNRKRPKDWAGQPNYKELNPQLQA